MSEFVAQLLIMPPWALAFTVITSGWVAAFLARYSVSRVLTVLRFDRLCDRTGVCEFLRKGEVGSTPAQLVGSGFYWIALAITLLEAARLLDLTVFSEFRRRLVEALPAALSALMVFAVGFMAVAFVAGFVRTVTRNAGSAYANLWSRIARFIGIILVTAIALEQAEIRGSILAGVIQITFGAFAFGAALAFGLGCKDIARTATEKFIADVRERHKDVARTDMEG